MILEVSDNGEPPQASTRVLNINVLDVDDHKPRFIREIVSHKTKHFSVTNFSLIWGRIGLSTI